MTVFELICWMWKNEGMGGFYRGVSASYVGALETALNFVIYERFKCHLLWWEHTRRQSSLLADHHDDKPLQAYDLQGSKGGSKLSASSDTGLCMIASAFSKIVAITLTYPHGMANFIFT